MSSGPIGSWLRGKLAEVIGFWTPYRGMGETYVLGDNPLVSLSALQSAYDRRRGSSGFVDLREAPAAPHRLYTTIDTRLMLEDFFLKLQRFDQA